MNYQNSKVRERVDDEKVFLASAIEAQDQQQQLDPEIIRLKDYRWIGANHQKIFNAIKQQRLSGKPADLPEVGMLLANDLASMNLLLNPEVIPQPSQLMELSRKLLKKDGHGVSTVKSNATNVQAETDEWEPMVQEWPVMDSKAYHGLAGDFVELATRNSEADPAAILSTFLVRFGCECGSAPTLYVGDTKHKARLAAVIVGSSSKARKGTSGKPVLRLFEKSEWQARYSPGPFSSGEGIIYSVRDENKKWNEKEQCEVVIDPGVKDKRLFILDEEFSGTLSCTKREGNTLSTIIRCTWDTGNLDPLTKTSKIRATGAHVCWVSHITLNELNSRLNETESFNGFANRILWVCAKRAKIVPWPEPMPDDELNRLRLRLESVLERTRRDDAYLLKWSDEAKDAWVHQYYAALTTDNQGLAGCVINRADAQVIRLAMIYCLLDGMDTIGHDHLEAAVAFWYYCEQSALYIFNGRQADHTAQRILDALGNGPMTGTDIHRLFDNHVSKGKIESVLSELFAADRVEYEKIKTKGRPATVWKLKISREKSEKSVKSQTDDQKTELNSLNSHSTQEKSEIERKFKVEV